MGCNGGCGKSGGQKQTAKSDLLAGKTLKFADGSKMEFSKLDNGKLKATKIG